MFKMRLGSKLIKICLLIIILFVILGITLIVTSFLPYEFVKGIIDSLAPDGEATSFSLMYFNWLIPKYRLIAIGVLIINVFLFICIINRRFVKKFPSNMLDSFSSFLGELKQYFHQAVNIKKLLQCSWFFSISIVVLLLSFWLRWSGVYWQLPDTRMNDEQVVMNMTHDISLHRDFLRIKKPDGFWYCPAYNYLSLIVYKIFDRFVVGVGLFPSQPLIPLWTHFLICRILSIFMSIGTIAVLILMFKNVFGKLTASLAGLFFALNGIEIYRAVIAHSDTMAVFLSTLTLYLAFKIINTKGWALYLVAGAIYGAAVSSRLFALGFFFPLVAGHILAQKGDNPVSRMLNALRDRRWLILPFAALGGFAITNPQSLLAVGQFLKAVQIELISDQLGNSLGAFKTAAELLSQMKFVYSNLLATTFSPSISYSKIYSSPISILNLLPLALALVGLIILLIRRFKLG